MSQNGKCPFWNEHKLCDIYTKLGEEHLCDTCKNFPRITQDYTAFSEHMLSFACPEAARLMLAQSENFSFATELPSGSESVDYDTDLMSFLLAARKATFKIFDNFNFTFAARLRQSLAFNAEIQDMLNHDNFDISNIPHSKINFKISDNTDISFIFDLHKRLDIMSKSWLEILDKTAANAGNNKISTDFDGHFTVLAKYYVFRYYLTAIDNLNVLSTIKRILCAYIVNGHMLAASKVLTPEQMLLVMQHYSKEVEHSYENSELLEDEFLLNSDFSTENLLSCI